MRFLVSGYFNFIFFVLIISVKLISYVNYSNNIPSLGVPDAFTYYIPIDFFGGEVHPSRMLIYPLLIKAISIFDFQNSPFIVIWFQRVLSLVSVIVFFKLLEKAIKNKIIVVFFTIYFALNTNINEHDSSILAESIGVSFLIFYFNTIYTYITNEGNKSIITSSFLAILLLFIKPIFIIIVLLHLLLMVYFVFLKNKSLNKVKIFASIFIIIFPLLFHVFSMKRQYGYFGLSTVNVNNNLGNAIISGSYLNTKDSEIKNYISSFDKKTSFYDIVFSLYNVKRLNDYVKYLPDIYKNQAPKYISILPNKNYDLGRLNRFVKDSFFTKKNLSYILHRFISIMFTFKKLTCIMIIFTMLSFYMILKKKNCNIFYFLLSVYVLGNLIAVAVGGIGDWSRLLIFTTPAFVLLSANLTAILISVLSDMGILLLLKRFGMKFIYRFANGI